MSNQTSNINNNNSNNTDDDTSRQIHGGLLGKRRREDSGGVVSAAVVSVPPTSVRKISAPPVRVSAKPAPVTAAATAATTAKEKESPAPVAYLQQLFASTEFGRQLIQQSSVTAFEKPSQEAIDAYDLQAVRAIRSSDVQTLRAFLDEGKSLDACNRFGESLLHMACRRADVKIVKFLIREARVSVEVRDDFGRTPLHDACWTTKPNFDLMDVLVEASSPRLLIATDVRGHSPFHYARREHWPQWMQFLQDRTERFKKLLSGPVQVIA